MSFDFSVLMSLYKKEKPEFLRESLESILNQTYVPTEIVIVKDGPLTIELEQVLKEYSTNDKIKVYGYDENKGLGFALNFGVNKCRYDIIARMDTDDIASPDRFEKEILCLQEKKVDFVGSNTLEFIDTIDNVQSVRIMPENNDDIIKYSKTRNPFIHPSIMTYKSVILEAGNFRNYYLCEDYDMWTRIIKKGYKSYNIQENLVYMRVGKDFYKRRGGIKYCKALVSFKKELYKEGYMTRREYIKTKYATVIVSLMPGFFREFLYKKVLRGSSSVKKI